MTRTPDVFDRLQSLRGQSVTLGLAQVTRLLDRLDHPERDFPAVHVAGTNGKGSVCAMVASALRRAGHRVGLLTSPHLVDYSERIRVNGRRIEADEAGAILDQLELDDGSFEGSFFEVTTAVAFEHFRRRGVDVAVLEVGLGGRLDATNVCHPLATSIVTIGLDHTKTLGADPASIAAEKAGIVKPGIPVVMGRLGAEAEAVVEAIAARRGAPVLPVVRDCEVRVLSSSWDGLDVTVKLPGAPAAATRVPLPGRHQAHNVAVAALTAHTFDPRPEMTEQLVAGLEDTRWPGRLQKVDAAPVRVYDVAHNQAGVEALSRSLRELGLPEGSVAVVGVLGDKDLSAMAGLFSKHFRRAVATTPPHPLRARAAEETAAALAAAGIEVEVHPEPAVACEMAAQAAQAAGGWVVITGSLFTVGSAMKAFGDPVDAIDSRGSAPVLRDGP